VHASADYASQRVSYAGAGLHERDLAHTPLAQFERWYAEAVAAGVPEPNAMVLAAVDAAGSPSARTVLLKQADPRGFVFYTNYGSRKAAQIEATGRVALVFPWHAMHRQVSVRGMVERVPRPETEAYFGQRPWGSRIGAWASRQSAPLPDRAELEAAYAELARRWPDTGAPDDVPVPEHWGGYLVRAFEVEFWQGRTSRLHDRLGFGPAVGPGPGEPQAAAPDDVRTPALDDAAGWRVLRRQP